jgi:hypothetical protein
MSSKAARSFVKRIANGRPLRHTARIMLTGSRQMREAASTWVSGKGWNPEEEEAAGWAIVNGNATASSSNDDTTQLAIAVLS